MFGRYSRSPYHRTRATWRVQSIRGRLQPLRAPRNQRRCGRATTVNVVKIDCFEIPLGLFNAFVPATVRFRRRVFQPKWSLPNNRVVAPSEISSFRLFVFSIVDNVFAVPIRFVSRPGIRTRRPLTRASKQTVRTLSDRARRRRRRHQPIVRVRQTGSTWSARVRRFS